MTIHRINENLYQVESEVSARTYTVDLRQSEPVCTCPDAQFRGNKACKHVRACQQLPQPTGLERAAAKAAGLTDEQLKMWQAQYQSGPVACACLLELAARKLKAQSAPSRPIPAGVEALLEGATEAERARALEIYLL